MGVRRFVVLAIPCLVVLAQGAFMRAGHAEPYPALMMPAFRGTRTALDGSIGVDAIELAALFDDGTSAAIATRALFDPMPNATIPVACGRALRCQAASAPGTARWLRDRLATLHPSKSAASVEIRWYRDAYRVDDGVLRRAVRTLTESCVVTLPR